MAKRRRLGARGEQRVAGVVRRGRGSRNEGTRHESVSMRMGQGGGRGTGPGGGRRAGGKGYRKIMQIQIRKSAKKCIFDPTYSIFLHM